MLSPKDLTNLFSEGPDKVLAKAQKLSARGRHDQASQMIKEALERLGESADLRIELATLGLAAGRPKDAADALRALLKAHPSEVSRVEEYIGWARTQFSDVEALHEPLAEGHVARRNYKAAMECLERIQKNTLQGLIESRLANLKRFLEKGAAVPRSAVPTLYLAALGYETTGDWQKSLDCYRKILAAAPNDFPQVDERIKNMVGRHYRNGALRLAYAEMLAGLGHNERALEEQLKTLEADPRSVEQVARYIKDRLAAAPSDPELMWSSVRVDMMAGRVTEALETCGRLVEAGHRCADVEKLLEELSAAGKESVDSQLLLARVATAQDKPSRAIAAVVAAMGHESADPRAVSALEAILEKYPAEPRPYQILADCHLRAGRVQQCMETFRRLFEVDPSSGPAIATRLQAILASDPANTAASELLESISVESKDPRSALPFLRRRLREKPEEAAAVMDRLRAMIAVSPDDPALSLAGAEACLVSGQAATAWRFLQDAARPEVAPDPAYLHALVLAAGSSPEISRAASSFIMTRVSAWASRPEVVFALAEAAGRAGLLQDAVNGYRAAAAASPAGAAVCRDAVRSLAQSARQSSADDRACLAEILVEAGELPTAIEVLRGVDQISAGAGSRLVTRLQQALRRDPRNLDLMACLAQVSLASNQIARALEIARAGLAGREDAASAPLVLTYGDALCRQGKLAEGVRAYAAAVARDPALIQQGIERLRGVRDLDPGLEAARVALGRLLMNEGHVDDGLRELMEAWSARRELGPALLKELDRAARKHGLSPRLEMARARLLAEAGDPAAAAEVLGGQPLADGATSAEAITLIEEIVARHPECARGHLELGKACAQHKRTGPACSSLARAYELDRSLGSHVRAILGWLEKTELQDPAPRIARAFLEEAEQNWLAAAEACAEAAALGSSVEAPALLARVCAAPGAPARAHLLRAQACRLTGRGADAIKAVRAAMEKDGTLAKQALEELDLLVEGGSAGAAVLLARASCALALRDFESAARDLHEALSKDKSIVAESLPLARALAERQPGNPLAAIALARALEGAGQGALAAQALDEALTTGKGRRDLSLILERRRMAHALGDEARAREMLQQAEAVAPDRERFLRFLHDEAVAQAGTAGAPGDPVLEAILAGDYSRAATFLVEEPPSPRQAWVLERCGRLAEAAACLERLQDRDSGGWSAKLHDRVLSRALLGRGIALMGEVPLKVRTQPQSIIVSAAPPRRGRQSAKGGMS